jgi:hypothetical protein
MCARACCGVAPLCALVPSNVLNPMCHLHGCPTLVAEQRWALLCRQSYNLHPYVKKKVLTLALNGTLTSADLVNVTVTVRRTPEPNVYSSVCAQLLRTTSNLRQRGHRSRRGRLQHHTSTS